MAPISINGSGSITGISAGGLPDGSIVTADIADGAITDAKVNASAAIADSKLSGTTCKAWCNFNGTTASPSTIRASYNVSSVTKNGTGDYTVNFTTAMVDANYAVQVLRSRGDANCKQGASDTGILASSVRVFSASAAASPGYEDAAYVFVSVFR